MALCGRRVGRAFDHEFSEGANVGKNRGWLRQGGIFQKTRRLIVIDDGVHFWGNGWDCARKVGATKQLNIRIVDAELSLVH